MYETPVFLPDSDIFLQKGKQNTFDVIVRTRQRAGWQGYMRNVSETEYMTEFHSELEMLKKLIINQVEAGRQPQSIRR